MVKNHTPVRGIDVVSDPQEMADRMAALSAANAERAAHAAKEPLQPVKLIGTDYFSDVTATPAFPAYQPSRPTDDEIDAVIRKRFERKGCFDL